MRCPEMQVPGVILWVRSISSTGLSTDARSKEVGRFVYLRETGEFVVSKNQLVGGRCGESRVS